MIQSFAEPSLEKFFFDDILPRKAGWKNVERIVKRKLAMIHRAKIITDLQSPPGNRLEALKGDLAGFWSIRVNDQWRVVFRWTEGLAGPSDVDVVDYH